MAQRRPITSHPAFAPFLALWFAALFGLAVAVLPASLLTRAVEAAGLGAPTSAGRLITSGAAALLGAVLGLALALPLARRGPRDPRPLYAEPELAAEHPAAQEPVRRPLRVREELAEAKTGAAPDSEDDDRDASEATAPRSPFAGAEEGFMILTPQPTHPPRPAPELDALLEQFDTALAAFASGEDARPALRRADPDPVHAFVARQTGAPAPAPSPLGGRMPDHQAELRAALDKLAGMQGKE